MDIKAKYIGLILCLAVIVISYFVYRSYNEEIAQKIRYKNISEKIKKSDLPAHELNQKLIEIWFSSAEPSQDKLTPTRTVIVNINNPDQPRDEEREAEVRRNRKQEASTVQKRDFMSIDPKIHTAHINALLSLHTHAKDQLKASDRLYCYQGITQLALSAIVLKKQNNNLGTNKYQQAVSQAKAVLEDQIEQVVQRCQWQLQSDQIVYGAFLTLSGGWDLLEDDIYRKYISVGERTLNSGINKLLKTLKKLREDKENRTQIRYLEDRLKQDQLMLDKIKGNKKISGLF